MKIGMDLVSNCPVGGIHRKSIDHILFKCERAKDIWSQILNDRELFVDLNDSFIDRWQVFSNSYNIDKLEIIATCSWAIWNDRNNKLKGVDLPSSSVKRDCIFRLTVKVTVPHKISKRCLEILRATIDLWWNLGLLPLIASNLMLTSPDVLLFRLVWELLLDQALVSVTAISTIHNLNISEAALAEALAILKGLEFAISFELQKIIMEFDCIYVINLGWV